jgi:hypothetical protein
VPLSPITSARCVCHPNLGTLQPSLASKPHPPGPDTAVQGCTYTFRSTTRSFPFSCVPATRHIPCAHRRNGRRPPPVDVSTLAVYYLGKKPTHLPSFTPWDARTGILQLPLWLSTTILRIKHVREHDASTTRSTTVAAAGNATVAIDAKQSIASNVPTQLSAKRATHPAHDHGSSSNAHIGNLVTICIDSSQDVDGCRPQTNVPVCRRQPFSQTDGNRGYVNHISFLTTPLTIR